MHNFFIFSIVILFVVVVLLYYVFFIHVLKIYNEKIVLGDSETISYNNNDFFALLVKQLLSSRNLIRHMLNYKAPCKVSGAIEQGMLISLRSTPGMELVESRMSHTKKENLRKVISAMSRL